MKKVFCTVIAIVLIYSMHAQDSRSYVENELIIWLEQGVDAHEFATNSRQRIAPKEVLSERLNIWLFGLPYLR